MSQCEHPAGKCNNADDCAERICAAPISAYSQEDQEFFAFWYRHMSRDLMRAPLDNVRQSVARYIWDAARKA